MILIKYGDSVAINCTADALPPAKTKWQLPSAENVQIIESPLKIPSFQFTDEGYYICELDNGIEPPAQRTILVRGETIAAPNITKPTVKYVNISEGNNITLLCHCEMCDPLDKLLWVFENDQHELTAHGSLEDVISSNEHNIIDYQWKVENVSVNNSGTYTCQLNNQYGVDEYSIQVNVRQPPIVEKLEKDNLYHKCVVNKYVHFVEVKAKHPNLTIPSKVYDCNSFDGTSVDLTIVIVGKLKFQFSL